jgi:hypothetical protein
MFHLGNTPFKTRPLELFLQWARIGAIKLAFISVRSRFTFPDNSRALQRWDFGVPLHSLSPAKRHERALPSNAELNDFVGFPKLTPPDRLSGGHDMVCIRCPIRFNLLA